MLQKNQQTLPSQHCKLHVSWRTLASVSNEQGATRLAAVSIDIRIDLSDWIGRNRSNYKRNNADATDNQLQIRSSAFQD